MRIALIKNNVVQNVIAADSLDFIDVLKSVPDYPFHFDIGVQVDGVANGDMGSIYDPVAKTFSPAAPVVVIPNLESQLANIDFGSRLMADFSLLNTQRGLTDAQKYQLAQNLSGIVGLLESGDLGAVLTVLRTLVPDGVLLTQDILNAFIQKIQAYLAS